MSAKTRLTAMIASTVAVVLLATLAAYVVMHDNNQSDQSLGAGVTTLDSVPSAVHAQVVHALPALNPNLATDISQTYRIEPSGPLPHETRFVLPLNEPTQPSDEYLIIGLFAESADGPWLPLPTTVSDDRRSAVVRTPHLSWFKVVKVRIGKALQTARNLIADAATGLVQGAKDVVALAEASFHGFTDDLFAEARQPRCANEAEARAKKFVVIPEAGKNTFLWCFGIEDGKRIVKVVNNRRYPLSIAHPGFTVLDNGPRFKMRLAQLSRAMSGDSTVVFPREQAVFELTIGQGGGEAHLQAVIDDLAQSLYSLETAVRTALLFLTNFGAGTKLAAGGGKMTDEITVVEHVDALLQGAGCYSLFTEGSGDLGSVLSRCFSPDELLTAWGKAAVFLAPIMAFAPIASYMRSQLNALFDIIPERDRFKLTLDRLTLTGDCPAGESQCVDAASADIDGDGRTDEVMLVFVPNDDYDEPLRARVRFATGEQVEGMFQFTGGRRDPKKQRFSFLGFAEVDGRPGKEIFSKIYMDEGQGDYSWRISMIGYDSSEKKLGPIAFLPAYQLGGMHPISWLQRQNSKNFEASGFVCQRSAAGQPQFVTWRASHSLNDPEFQVETTIYEWREGSVGGYFEVLPQGKADSKYEFFPYGSGTAMRTLVRQRSTKTCDGLQPLPGR